MGNDSDLGVAGQRGTNVVAVTEIHDDEDPPPGIATSDLEDLPDKFVGVRLPSPDSLWPAEPGDHTVQRVGDVVEVAFIQGGGTWSAALDGGEQAPQQCDQHSTPSLRRRFSRKTVSGDRDDDDIGLVRKGKQRVAVFGREVIELLVPPLLDRHVQAEEVGTECLDEAHKGAEIVRDRLPMKLGECPEDGYTRQVFLDDGLRGCHPSHLVTSRWLIIKTHTPLCE